MNDEIAAVMSPTKWFRINAPDGSLWMETSDAEEAREEAQVSGWSLERLYFAEFSEWRKEAPGKGIK